MWHLHTRETVKGEFLETDADNQKVRDCNVEKTERFLVEICRWKSFEAKDRMRLDMENLHKSLETRDS